MQHQVFISCFLIESLRIPKVFIFVYMDRQDCSRRVFSIFVIVQLNDFSVSNPKQSWDFSHIILSNLVGAKSGIMVLGQKFPKA